MAIKKRDKRFVEPKKGEPKSRNNGKTKDGYTPAKAAIRATKRKAA